MTKKPQPGKVVQAVRDALDVSDEYAETLSLADLIRVEYTHKLSPKQIEYLGAYAEFGRHSVVREALGYSGSPHHGWLANNRTYREAYEVAQAIASEAIVDEIKRRAIEGVKRKKFFKGEPIIDPETGEQYAEQEYSDQLIMFLAKGLMPEVFRERSTVDINTSGELGDYQSSTAKEIARQNTAFLEQAKKIIANKNRTVEPEIVDEQTPTDSKDDWEVNEFSGDKGSPGQDEVAESDSGVQKEESQRKQGEDQEISPSIPDAGETQ